MDDSECLNCGVNFDDAETIWSKAWSAIPYGVREALKLHTYTRMIRFFFQRKRRGFDDSDLWSLDYTFAKLMAPRLRAFINQFGGRSVPCEMTQQEWLEILEKIHRALDLMVTSDGAYFMLSDDQTKEIHEGLGLFQEHLFSLWD